MARPLDGDEPKSEIVNVRMTPTMKNALRGRARRAGRNMSQEICVRLDESLEFDYEVVRSVRRAA